MPRASLRARLTEAYHARRDMLLLPDIARRRRLGRGRSLPDFLIIGAPRSGTTDLFYVLVRHPQIRREPGVRKEIHFFDTWRHALGLDWYRSHFPTVAERARSPAGRPWVAGEATPSYLAHPQAPARIRDALPAARLVVILRDPVDRAYSNYHHRLRRGYERRTFAEAVEVEEPLLGTDAHASGPRWRRVYPYLRQGLYASFLRRWHAMFPREQLLVIAAEDYFADRMPALNAVTAHLGIEPFAALPERVRGNPAYPPMSAETRARLRSVYRDPNEELFEYLGRRLPWQTA